MKQFLEICWLIICLVANTIAIGLLDFAMFVFWLFTYPIYYVVVKIGDYVRKNHNENDNY